MNTHRIIQGFALPLEVALVNGQGIAQGYPDGTPITAIVWPGGDLAARFAVDVAWDDAPSGRLTVSVGDDQTAELAPGRYQGLVSIDDPDQGLIPGFRWTFDVVSAAAPIDTDPPAGPVYCTFADVCAGRPWISEYQSDDEAGGFAREIRTASRWFDEIVVNRGGSRHGRAYLAGLLEAGRLEVLEPVRQAVALQVAALVCESRNGPGSDSADNLTLANRFRTQSLALATGSTVLLRVGTDGHFRINLGAARI